MSTKTFDGFQLPFPVKTLNPLYDIDGYAGPYENPTEASESVGDLKAIGRKVGIKEYYGTGSNDYRVKEYAWGRDETTGEWILVPKEGATYTGKVNEIDIVGTEIGLSQTIKDRINNSYDYNNLDNLPDLSVFDNVDTFPTVGDFPAIGKEDVFYIDNSTGKLYRWNGTGYSVVAGDLTLGETASTAYRGDRGKIAYDHSQEPHAPADAQKNSDITKGEIENKLTGSIDSHTHSFKDLEDIPTKTSDFENTGEGGATVFLTEIREGTNVTIDNTNPKRPFVNVDDPILKESIVVSLPDGVTLGKYVTDDVIPGGLTFTEFVKSAAQSALEPTVNLTSSTTIQFNQKNISNDLDFSYVINSFGGSVESVKLEWRRGGSGDWDELELTDALNATTYTHIYTETKSFNTAAFNYRYTVVDSLGGTKTKTLNITPAAYQEPTLSGFSVGSTSRDRGNILTLISGSISRKSNNVPIESYTIQYRVDTGSWNDLITKTLSESGGTISESHNDIALVNSDRIDYRVLIKDEYQTTQKSSTTINFRYRNLLGYSTETSLDLNQVLSLSNSILSDSKVRTVDNVSAAEDYYTYYAYRADDGDLNNVIMDGAAPVKTSFQEPTDVSGTNGFGAEVTYRVYRSNADEAFTNNSLEFL